MDTIQQRIEQIKNAFFESNSDFEEAVGLRKNTLSNYINKNSKPSSDILEKIVTTLDVDAMWLLTGKDNMKRSERPLDFESGKELFRLCKELVNVYNQKEKLMSSIVSKVKEMEDCM